MPPADPAQSDRICARFVLPVSGLRVALTSPTGEEDLLLSEYGGSDTTLALSLAQRLARADDDGDAAVPAWSELPAADLDVLLLRLRQALIGDRITGDLYCRDPQCGSRVDISFSIEAYLAHHRPRPVGSGRRGWRVAASAAEPGWFVFTPPGASADAASSGLRFRLPTVADQIHAVRAPDPEAALIRLCIQPPNAAAPLRRRAETAMEALAPLLSGELQGQCPDCGANVAAHFDPRRYCLRELRESARFVYADIDLLARRYHWDEESILGMPSVRRAVYAEMAAAGAAA